MSSLLAVDLGLKTGLALYDATGRLVWYRSHNYGTTERLKHDAPRILDAINDLTAVVVEGGGNLAHIWQKETERRGLTLVRIGAETWRNQLLFSREQKSGPEAKRHAGELARNVISWSGARKPTSLRHDAAEAILIGLWGAVHIGWLPELPKELRRI
jgi:hypothetical protein